jgi:hypothetical protein
MPTIRSWNRNGLSFVAPFLFAVAALRGRRGALALYEFALPQKMRLPSTSAKLWALALSTMATIVKTAQ